LASVATVKEISTSDHCVRPIPFLKITPFLSFSHETTCKKLSLDETSNGKRTCLPDGNCRVLLSFLLLLEQPLGLEKSLEEEND
jgi:hypothetical protein